MRVRQPIPAERNGAPGLKTLVIAPSWAGDLVMAQALFRLLHERGTAVDLVAPPSVLALARRMPEVGHLWPLPVGHGTFGLAARARLGRALRARAYDQSIVLPNTWKSALVPFIAGIPRRTGYTGEWRIGLLNDRRRLDTQRLPRMVDRYCALGVDADEAVTAPRPRLTPSPQGIATVLARLHLARPSRPVLGLCPGAEYGPAKRWPAPSFAAVAMHALHQGWDAWIFGSEKDREVARAVREKAPLCVDLTGQTEFDEVVDLMSLVSAVVTNDSGLMHVAAALSLPLVAVFGSSSPEHTPPLFASARALSLGLDCSPCFERTCPLGHTRCLNDLAPAAVIAALAGIAPRFAEAL
ncbi:MAG: lipopolysaccharide heptosyltransferase II [Acidiferrobacteraceae bacterium]